MLGIRTTFKRPPSEVLELIYMRGLLEQAHQRTNAMFHEIFGNPVFSATMSRKRFEFLIAHISFDDHITRPTPWQHNRFAAFCEIFEEFNKNCENFYFVMIICLWMKLFIQRERKSVSNNLIRANQPSMECCINQ